MRTSLVTALLIVPGIGLGTGFAQSPTAPAPGADEILFVGQVPAPAGTAVALRMMDLDAGVFSDCDTVTTFAGAGDSPNRSRFEILTPAACLRDVEAAMVCWSSAQEDCAVIAQQEGLGIRPEIAPLSEMLGRTIDVGLLAPRTIEVPDVPPEVDVVESDAEGLPATGTADPHEGDYTWLLWAGVVALGVGLAVGGVTFARRRR